MPTFPNPTIPGHDTAADIERLHKRALRAVRDSRVTEIHTRTGIPARKTRKQLEQEAAVAMAFCEALSILGWGGYDWVGTAFGVYCALVAEAELEQAASGEVK